ncbi:metastasis-associated protein MTA3 isoform X2 [Nematostella vectensis]|uniref:metastasis-associated protein MTA3 isoform X2 n=1 Tax=Nematostella vectensis TaxID=45351 RepID=UPI0020770D52|nr:metastasis-associated protein MTA3 isoform X2 [Nematostella vectensis]
MQAEEDAEVEMGDIELEDVSRHQLSHREVFLSRQYENINANTIRGKCLVTLYNEAEVLPKYLEKEDWFCYFLVYDPQQKSLVADRGEMGIGPNYQCLVPKKCIDPSTDDRDLSQMETLVWKPDNSLSDRQVDQFLVVARSVGTFARALDCSSSVKQPSLHMSAAAASRDVTLFHAMTTLHNSMYQVGKALSQLVPSGGPVLCRDEMEDWSAGEANLFEEALQKYGKDFNDIQKDFLPWKSFSSIVEYYYMWKTTDRYLQQKRQKAVSKECNLTQIYIPGLAPSNPAQPGKKQTSTIILTPPPGVTSNLVGATCEGCYGCTSQQWYPWSPSNSQHKFWLCTLCWIYWKKYGGLKKPDGFSGRGQAGLEPRYTCRVCGKVFNRAERLSSHMQTHKMYKCVVRGCEKLFNTKAHLSRHLTCNHGYRPPSPRKLKPRSPFYMCSTHLTRVSRRLCGDLIDVRHWARAPGANLNLAEIKAQCIKRVTDPKCTAILKAERKMKHRVLEKAVEQIKANPRKPKPAKPTLLPLPGINSHQDNTSPPPTSPAHHVTSPARKMMPPHKMTIPPITPKASDWKYAAIPPTKAVAANTNHMLARKRSYSDTSTLQQNGIDGPAPKRLSATSPLGKKGCECTYCGKILHNQASLTHHEQTVHATATEAPKQRSYPAYCDVSPAIGPGSNKIMPYAHHSVTSYNNGQAQGRAASGQNHADKGKPFLLPKQAAQGKGGPVMNASSKPVQRPANVNRRSHYQGNGTPHTHRDKNNPQYIDPPEEFLYTASRKTRKSRKTLVADAVRKVARKPWKLVQCNPKLRELIIDAKPIVNNQDATANEIKKDAVSNEIKKEPVAPTNQESSPIVIDDD